MYFRLLHYTQIRISNLIWAVILQSDLFRQCIYIRCHSNNQSIITMLFIICDIIIIQYNHVKPGHAFIIWTFFIRNFISRNCTGTFNDPCIPACFENVSVYLLYFNGSKETWPLIQKSLHGHRLDESTVLDISSFLLLLPGLNDKNCIYNYNSSTYGLWHKWPRHWKAWDCGVLTLCLVKAEILEAIAWSQSEHSSALEHWMTPLHTPSTAITWKAFCLKKLKRVHSWDIAQNRRSALNSLIPIHFISK